MHKPENNLDLSADTAPDKYPPLTDEQRKLIESRLGLVFSFVPSFLGRGLDYDDLAQEACLGLVEAATRFEPERGIDFSTYTSPRIRGAMLDALREHNPLSRKEQTMLGRWSNMEAKLISRLQRQPTVDEIADELEFNLAKIGEVQMSRSRQVIKSIDEVVSIEAENLVLHEILTDELYPSDTTDEAIDVSKFVKTAKHLSVQEKTTLLLYYYGDYTNKQIGNYFGLTEMRASQIRKAALGKLALQSNIIGRGAQVSTKNYEHKAA